MNSLLRKIFFREAPAKGETEMKSFRACVQTQILRLRRIQQICLPSMLMAFIGLMFTASWELDGAFRVFFTVFGGLAFLGELCCFFKARGLVCPECRKRIGCLFLDSSCSKNGALLLPDGLLTIHHCPHCHTDWERGEERTAKSKPSSY